MLDRLRQNRGTSLLISLVVFLVACMVSVVIISASLTAVKRVKDDESARQDYLAVSSAARIVSDGIASTSCTLVETTVRTDGGDASTTRAFDPSLTNGRMGDIFYDMCNSICSGSSTASGEYTIELVGPADDSDVRQKLPVCKLSVSMDAYYNISGTVTMVMASGALDEAPRINFTGSPSLTIESSPTTDETDDEGIVSYTDVTNTIYKWTTKMSTME